MTVSVKNFVRKTFVSKSNFGDISDLEKIITRVVADILAQGKAGDTLGDILTPGTYLSSAGNVSVAYWMDGGLAALNDIAVDGSAVIAHVSDDAGTKPVAFFTGIVDIVPAVQPVVEIVGLTTDHPDFANPIAQIGTVLTSNLINPDDLTVTSGPTWSVNGAAGIDSASFTVAGNPDETLEVSWVVDGQTITESATLQHEAIEIVEGNVPTFDQSAYIGETVDVSLNEGIFESDSGIASIVETYTLDNVNIADPSVVLVDADALKTVRGTSTVTTNSGAVRVFDIGEFVVYHQVATFSTALVDQDYVGLTGTSDYDLTPHLTQGRGIVASIISGPSWVTISNNVVQTNKADAGLTSDEQIVIGLSNTNPTPGQQLSFLINIAAVVNAPEQMIEGTHFNITASGIAGRAILNVLQLPDNGGASPIGAVVSIDGAPTFNISTLTLGEQFIDSDEWDGTPQGFQIASENSQGVGTLSASVTRTVADTIAPTHSPGNVTAATGTFNYTVDDEVRDGENVRGTFHIMTNNVTTAYADGAAFIAAKATSFYNTTIAVDGNTSLPVNLTGHTAGLTQVHTMFEDEAGNFGTPQVQEQNLAAPVASAYTSTKIANNGTALIRWAGNVFTAGPLQTLAARINWPTLIDGTYLFKMGGNETEFIVAADGSASFSFRDTSNSTRVLEGTFPAGTFVGGTAFDWWHHIDLTALTYEFRINGAVITPTLTTALNAGNGAHKESVGYVMGNGGSDATTPVIIEYYVLTYSFIPHTVFGTGEELELDLTGYAPEIYLDTPMSVDNWNGLDDEDPPAAVTNILQLGTANLTSQNATYTEVTP